jgi:hypothetical protein
MTYDTRFVNHCRNFHFMKLTALCLGLGFILGPTSMVLAKQTEVAQNTNSEKPFRFIDPAAFGFGQPGFVADATFIDTQDFENQPGGIDFFELRTIAPVGFKKWGDFLLAGSVAYTLTEVGFQGWAGLENETLHTLEAQIVCSWKPQDSRWSALSFVTPGISTDFREITGDDFEVAGIGLINYRVSDSLSLATGVFGRYAANEGMIVPALGLIWQCEPFIVQLTPPFVVLGWRATDELTLSLSAYPSGGAWDIDDSNVNRIQINGWQTAASAIYKLTENLTASLRVGFNIAGELELQDASDNVISNEDLEMAPFAAVNLRFSF